jgi:GTP-binding protein Era
MLKINVTLAQNIKQNKSMNHKSGFVNIIGNPNVGKSTLMNALVGEKLSIITSKAQTTRHRIMGIVNGDDFQIVYSDTPGILKPQYLLHESMMKMVGSALTDADVLLYVTDVTESTDYLNEYIARIKDDNIPIILIINKLDLTTQEKLEKLVDKWKVILPKAEIYPISALNNFNIDVLFKRILDLIPEFPPYFPKDEMSDKTERFFVSEIIREKILMHYQKEVPYCSEVGIEDYKETENLISIRAIIFVARDSQKGIIIGHKGESIRNIGIEARKDMEEFLGKKVFLDLFVKVHKDWRNKPGSLKYFGYEQ